MQQLNWLQARIAGKPDEYAEAHLFGTNDSMDTHTFPEGVKSSIFV